MPGEIKTVRVIGTERVSRKDELIASLKALHAKDLERMNRWSEKQRKDHSKAISEWMTTFWANATEEKRAEHRKAIKDALSERYPKKRKS